MTCHCDDIYGPIVLGGPCRECGYPHYGQTCEEHKAEINASVKRIVSAMNLKAIKPRRSEVSFSFEFHAKPADVPALLESNGSAKNAPACVKDFVRRAVSDLPGDLVSVKAQGHLFNGDYQVSSCTIEVKPIAVTAPAEAAA